jgi:hypothetical protein
LLGLELPLGYMQRSNEHRQAFEQLEHDAEVLAVFIDAALTRNDVPQVTMLARESAQRLGGHVDVMDAHGDLLAGTAPSDDPASHSDIQAVLHGQGRVSARTVVASGVRMMSVAVSVHPGLEPRGATSASPATRTCGRSTTCCRTPSAPPRTAAP